VRSNTFPPAVSKPNLGKNGSDNLQWYYEPGDRIIDSFIIRDVFCIPEDADAVKEVDRLIHEMQDVAEHIAAFAGYFTMEAAT